MGPLCPRQRLKEHVAIDPLLWATMMLMMVIAMNDGDDAEDNDKSGDDDIEMEEEAANKVLPEDLRATSNLQNSSRTLIEQSRIVMIAMNVVIIMKMC